MPDPIFSAVDAVPPTLIGLSIQRLQRLPNDTTRSSDRLMLVATCTGRNDEEIAALFVRLVTAAFVCRDPRWRSWRTSSTASLDAAIDFEALVLDLFARLPLAHDLTASVDHFFAALCAGLPAQGRA